MAACSQGMRNVSSILIKIALSVYGPLVDIFPRLTFSTLANQAFFSPYANSCKQIPQIPPEIVKSCVVRSLLVIRAVYQTSENVS